MELRTTDRISENEQERVYGGLLEYNLARLEDKDPRELGVFADGGDGSPLAGLIAQTHGRWLTIRYLWVSEGERGRGLGSSLLAQAEEEARRRGCTRAFVDTFNFQAPEFYLRHGYNEVFVLEDYPVTGKRYYYTKTL